MNEITSVNNELVKDTVKLAQRKYREETNLFLLEGFKPIEEAFQSGIEVKYAFVLKGKEQNYSFLGNKIILTNEAVLKKISTTDSAPDAVGVGVQKKFEINDIADKNKIVLLENIRDLGNLGTILRTAVAFGVEGVILYGDTADVYNPKCVRSAVGNLWKTPVIAVNNFSVLDNVFQDYRRVATLPRATTYLADYKPTEKTLVMFGSEADGLSQQLIDFATESVKIEMADNVESLNLSVSCAVVLYKMFIV